MYQKGKKKDNKVKVWDLSLRLFHFVLIFLIIGSYISAKLDMLNIHQYFGVSLLGLISFRILWGFIGTNYSRFASFNISIKGALAQFSKQNQNKSIRTPLGSFSTLSFIFVLLVLSISGLFSSDDILYDAPLAYLAPKYVYFWTDIHNLFHFILYFLVGIHILAITYYQVFKKHKIIERMVDGYTRINKTSVTPINEKPIKGVLLIFIFILTPILIMSSF
jgi:cytochrome b